MEVLIVVAILATLTAIAVPNLSEAQTRSKISRTKADLRAIGTGLELYRIDHLAYPLVGNPAQPGPWDLAVPYQQRLVPITTPVSYVQTLPQDPFAPPSQKSHPGLEYCYAPGNLYHGGAAKYSANQYRRTIYSLAGRGPDKEIQAGAYCLAHPEAYQSQLAIRASYDPTNGTLSQGDIVQLNCSRL